MKNRAMDGLMSIALIESSEFTQKDRLDAIHNLDQESLLEFMIQFDWMNNPELFSAAYVRYRNQDKLPAEVQEKWQQMGSTEFHARAYLSKLAPR